MIPWPPAVGMRVSIPPPLFQIWLKFFGPCGDWYVFDLWVCGLTVNKVAIK